MVEGLLKNMYSTTCPMVRTREMVKAIHLEKLTNLFTPISSRMLCSLM